MVFLLIFSVNNNNNLLLIRTTESNPAFLFDMLVCIVNLDPSG